MHTVRAQAVPGYHTLIAHPMDLSTMADKAAHGAYKSFAPFVADFELMIRNCLQFNRNNVFFYKAGERMKRMVVRARICRRGWVQGAKIISGCRAHYEQQSATQHSAEWRLCPLDEQELKDSLRAYADESGMRGILIP